MDLLIDPTSGVYCPTKEGLLFEVDVHTLEATRPSHPIRKLGLPPIAYPHFKGGHSSSGRVVIPTTKRTTSAGPTTGDWPGWDGTTWTVVERKPFNEVSGCTNMGSASFATGWAKVSAALKVVAAGSWTTYRLPMANHTQDQKFTTQWMWIREVESERHERGPQFKRTRPQSLLRPGA